MENIEIQNDLSNEKTELFIDEKSKRYLTEIRKWTKFLAILGFIFIGLIVLLGLILTFSGSMFGSYMGGIERIAILIIYLLIGVLYFFPIYYLLKFAVNMKSGLEQNKQHDISVAFEFLKSHYKFIGILTIVVLGLYVLIGIVAALAGLFSMM